MKTKIKNFKNKQGGITLVALVIMIIILLILATISIQALTNTGLFAKAQEAKEKTKNATENQAKTLNEYEDELNKYVSGTTQTQKLADKVKVGDYVEYTPDELGNESLTTLKTNLNTYSGNSNSTVNPAIKRDDLKWRVLDIQNGQVRLISETPTTSEIELKGFNGYNNAVKLLDNACNVLYNISKLANKVQNLKIEDITDYINEKDYSKFNTEYGSTNFSTSKYYPNILLKEKEQKVNGIEGNKLGMSQQDEYIKQTEEKEADELELKYTYWEKEMDESDFTNSKYYELFIKKGENKYKNYWISSRCLTINSDFGCYFIREVENGSLKADDLCGTSGYQSPLLYAFRPVVTLNSNVKIDNTNSGDGSTAEQAYAIK